MNPVYQEPGPCDCGRDDCPVNGGTKLNRDGHVVGCDCPTCNARGNQRKGRRGEITRHAVLSAKRAHTDEYPDTYPLTITTQDKVGDQVPASFIEFTESEWFRRAMAQARKKIVIGNDADPALYLEPPTGRVFVLVEVTPDTKLGRVG
jgi:hypothetical protein